MGKNLFNSIKLQKPQKNVFDLTHDVKLSADMGNLTPILALECVPGDKFELGCESLIRFAPMIAPVMHRMDVSMHYFFVPNRILWKNWEKFITDANSGAVIPFMDSSLLNDNAVTGNPKKFADYMGVPPPSVGSTSTQINLLPFLAYQRIWNEFYRDQNLQTPLQDNILNPQDGNIYSYMSYAEISNLLNLKKRAWEHDYFTASLPFAQKGAAVDIPLGEISGDVLVKTSGATTTLTGTTNITVPSATSTPPYAPNQLFAETDGLEIAPTTINDLRRAFRLQEWLEKNARGGTRYIENILTHFGVRSSDKRLQRPEYITGVKSPVIISEIVNTTGQVTQPGEENLGLPQGNMAGHGMSVSSGRSGTYFCEEHGYIIGIMSVMPKTAYQQGIPKTYLKNDTLDYFWPSFAHIGEQPVETQEIYAYTSNAAQTFGYVPRYAEYKFMPSRVAGDFRDELKYWHLGRIFDTEPALNGAFIQCDPTKRIFAVNDPTGDSLYCHVLNKIKAVRPMPKFGTPMF
jgi:hypothetical protein